MKKILSFTLAIFMCLSLCACGEGKQNNAFEEEYKSLFLELNFYNLKCDSLCRFIYDIWDIVGANRVTTALSYMLSMPDDFDEYWNNPEDAYNYIECDIGDAYGWLNNSSFGISFSEDAKEFHALCMTFKNLYNEIPTIDSTIKDKMKTFRTNYGETHADEFALINELYISISSFADFSLEPSGSLSSYGNSIDAYNKEIALLIKSADIFYLL